MKGYGRAILNMGKPDMECVVTKADIDKAALKEKIAACLVELWNEIEAYPIQDVNEDNFDRAMKVVSK